MLIVLSSFTNKIGQIFPSATENFTSHSTISILTYSHLLPSSLMTGPILKLDIADSMPSCIIIVMQEKREDTFYAINSNFIALQFICIYVRFCACVSVCMHMCLCIFNAMKLRDSPFVVILSILFSVVSKELFSFSTFINFFFVVF